MITLFIVFLLFYFIGTVILNHSSDDGCCGCGCCIPVIVLFVVFAALL